MAYSLEIMLDYIDDKLNDADGETIAQVAQILGLKAACIGTDSRTEEPIFEDITYEP